MEMRAVNSCVLHFLSFWPSLGICHHHHVLLEMSFSARRKGLLEKTGRALSDRYLERTKAMRCFFLLTCAISLARVEETCQEVSWAPGFPCIQPWAAVAGNGFLSFSPGIPQQGRRCFHPWIFLGKDCRFMGRTKELRVDGACCCLLGAPLWRAGHRGLLSLVQERLLRERRNAALCIGTQVCSYLHTQRAIACPSPAANSAAFCHCIK
nr:PREDICTED: uncharacterized protein LOC104143007 [Struthio camelus australis]